MQFIVDCQHLSAAALSGSLPLEKQNRTKVFEESPSSISHSNDVTLQLEVTEEMAEKDRMCFVMVCKS